jgi:peptidoglycan/LPS O-acetylase OafA/YrhL
MALPGEELHSFSLPHPLAWESIIRYNAQGEPFCLYSSASGCSCGERVEFVILFMFSVAGREMIRLFRRLLLDPVRDEGNRTRKKIENIQGLRGAAILLVVFAHIMAVEQKYGHGDGILPDFFVFGVSGVDLFFVISGFVAVTATRGHFRQPLAAAQFFYNRISRIYPLYWLYSFLVLGIYLYRPELVNASQGHRVHVLASFLLLPQDLLPLLNVGWALIHIMYFYCIFTLLLLAAETQLPKLMGVWALAVVIGDLMWRYGMPAAPTASLRLITHPLTLEFIGGCIVAKLIYSDMRSYGLAVLLLGMGSLFTGMSIYYSGSPGTVPREWLRVGLFGFPYVLIVYGAVALEMNSVKIFPRFLSFIGDASYSIYLSHVLVISAIGRAWNVVSTHGRVDNLVMVLLVLVSVTAFGRASYRIFEIPLLSMTRRLRSSLKIDSLPAVPAQKS